jgi:hypothetical protein
LFYLFYFLASQLQAILEVDARLRGGDYSPVQVANLKDKIKADLRSRDSF